MNDSECNERTRGWPAFAWRRWHVGLGVLLVIHFIAMSDWGLDGVGGAVDGASAEISREDRGDAVWSLAFNGGTRLASSTVSGEVRLSDLAADGGVFWRASPSACGRSLAVSPGGRILAIWGDGPIVGLCEAGSALELEPLDLGKDLVRSVAFSHDGRTLAVGLMRPDKGSSAQVALWEWPRRRRVASLDGHRGSVGALAFSADDSKLVAADTSGDVTFWDMTTRGERARLRAHKEGIKVLAYSPAGDQFATACYRGGVVRLWDAAREAPLGSLPKVSTGVNALAFSPDGTTLAMARADGIASLFDVASGREVGSVRVETGAFQAIAFSADGRIFATGGFDGSVRIWDTRKVVAAASRRP
jgi:WD40 repeat protein